MAQAQDIEGMLEQEGLTDAVVTAFREIVYAHFREHGRSLPWRETSDPYSILVSEIMLQQTQVERVLSKYEEFLRRFPDLATLAQAGLREILEVWQGLGYNRRAMALQRIAQRLVAEHGGQLPDSAETLRTFPGIGTATAGALAAFAYNKPAVFIETNIRRVFLHIFFPHTTDVSDREILPLVETTLDPGHVRQWYYALMDYGVMLKKVAENPNRRSRHHHRQSPFADSDRRIRGQILKALVNAPALTMKELVSLAGKSRQRVEPIVGQLVTEGFLVRNGDRFGIAEGGKERRG